ncbi:MAG: NYN domain-containing protein [Bacteroidales bacterium]|jgi:uncharacterized LabA/DUF88 family protein|nr:NYN domain-containing protein [Bacteroidales bacterium]
MEKKADLNFAVLIDAENVPYSNVKGMLDEIARFGVPTIKRIYGDWTVPNVSGWKSVLLEHAITPIQQYSYTSGKNSSDSAMIIDAMDILHTNRVDGFCLVSSDSDFTRLATRLRESGMYVIGLGERKTPKPFIAACDKFIYIEIINKEQKQLNIKSSDNIDNEKQVEKINDELIGLIKSTIEDLADDNGWAFLAEVGNLLNKKRPDFDSRNYGFSKLTPFIKSLSNYFEVEEKTVKNTHIKHIYVKIKE